VVLYTGTVVDCQVGHSGAGIVVPQIGLSIAICRVAEPTFLANIVLRDITTPFCAHRIPALG
jgi:hypothetical protein